VLCLTQSDDTKVKLEKEIEQRIEIMESVDYDKGPPLNNKDFIAMAIVAIVCIIGMVWGVM